jgi:hypothetical protein
MTAQERKTLRAISDWTGHTKPRRPMNPKPIAAAILLLFLALCLLAIL